MTNTRRPDLTAAESIQQSARCWLCNHPKHRTKQRNERDRSLGDSDKLEAAGDSDKLEAAGDSDKLRATASLAS